MKANSFSTMSTGAKLLVGLVLVVLLVIIGAHFYRQSEDGLSALQGQGPDAARRGIGLSQEGVKLLPPNEQRELGALYDEALQNLHTEEKQRFLTLAKKGQAASDQEIAESSDLIQRALRTLPPEKIDRLVALVGKAVQLQMAQKQAPAS